MKLLAAVARSTLAHLVAVLVCVVIVAAVIGTGIFALVIYRLVERIMEG